jgi:DNA polymerase III subunit delta
VRLKAAQVDAFLARPRPEVATVLLYGPDAGLVAERAKALALKVVGTVDDPFRTSELDPDLLEREPGRLVEEAQALTLMGGRRLVRVRDADERVAKACKQLLGLADQAGFVVMEAGELAGGSRLRRTIEEAPKAAALPCFRADERAMPAFVRETLAGLGLRAEGEAVTYLAGHLGGDRAVTRRELEKLALYLADQSERVVRLRDAAAVIGDSDAVELDDMVRAALLGDRGQLERTLDRLLGEGANPSALLRACARTLNQALRLKAEAATPGGKPVAAALGPMHFRQKELLEAVLRDWSADRLLGALARLQGAEIRSRQAKAPAELICREALAGLAGR